SKTSPPSATGSSGPTQSRWSPQAPHLRPVPRRRRRPRRPSAASPSRGGGGEPPGGAVYQPPPPDLAGASPFLASSLPFLSPLLFLPLLSDFPPEESSLSAAKAGSEAKAVRENVPARIAARMVFMVGSLVWMQRLRLIRVGDSSSP